MARELRRYAKGVKQTRRNNPYKGRRKERQPAVFLEESINLGQMPTSADGDETEQIVDHRVVKNALGENVSEYLVKRTGGESWEPTSHSQPQSIEVFCQDKIQNLRKCLAEVL